MTWWAGTRTPDSRRVKPVQLATVNTPETLNLQDRSNARQSRLSAQTTARNRAAFATVAPYTSADKDGNMGRINRCTPEAPEARAKNKTAHQRAVWTAYVLTETIGAPPSRAPSQS
jgi:hypothetical protein